MSPAIDIPKEQKSFIQPVFRAIFSPLIAGGPCGVTPEAALKILIHYGNRERPDKLLKLFFGWQIGRTSKFFRINWYA